MKLISISTSRFCRFIKIGMHVSALLLVVVSCNSDFNDINNAIDPKQYFIGKWVCGSEFYKYVTDSTGFYWDTIDDVHEDEAQPFKWEYNEDDKSLTHIHWMEMTQDWTVPRVYTVVKLNDSCLVYKDKSGKSYSFTKIK